MKPNQPKLPKFSLDSGLARRLGILSLLMLPLTSHADYRDPINQEELAPIGSCETLKQQFAQAWSKHSEVEARAKLSRDSHEMQDYGNSAAAAKPGDPCFKGAEAQPVDSKTFGVINAVKGYGATQKELLNAADQYAALINLSQHSDCPKNIAASIRGQAIEMQNGLADAMRSKPKTNVAQSGSGSGATRSGKSGATTANAPSIYADYDNKGQATSGQTSGAAATAEERNTLQTYNDAHPDKATPEERNVLAASKATQPEDMATNDKRNQLEGSGGASRDQAPEPQSVQDAMARIRAGQKQNTQAAPWPRSRPS